MTFMDRAINGTMDVWESYFTQPFVKELADGTLSPEFFKNYIIQDSLYLKEYARVFALGMYKSKSLEDMKIYYSILNFVNDDESNTRVKYLRGYNISDDDLEKIAPLKENKGYTDFMLAVSEDGDTPEILMAVLPCMISYHYIFKRIVETNKDVKSNRYYDMIRDYVTDGYKKSCDKWADFANKKCESLSSERQEKLIEIFRQSSVHESYFWDMSYQEAAL